MAIQVPTIIGASCGPTTDLDQLDGGELLALKIAADAAVNRRLDRRYVPYGNEALAREIQDKNNGFLWPFFAAWLAAHPEVDWAQWEQYAPYFNDGDPCEWAIQTHKVGKGKPYRLGKCVYQAPNTVSAASEEIEDESSDGYGDDDEYVPEELQGACRTMYSMLGDIEDLLRVVYGYDSKATIMRDGIYLTSADDHD